jgi:Zn-dependent peptidase ImmA (M78 family)
MDLADCGSPERLLEVIFRYYPDLPRRVPIKTIAADTGILEFKVLEVDGFIGGLVADPEKNNGIILVKNGLPEKRRRYTQGHELGHFLIPSHGYQRQCSKRDLEENSRTTAYQRQEAEANRFSAGLLMPKPMFVKDMDALGTADASHIRQLSDLYYVSMEAVANRYVELTADSCAVIFSRDGTVRYGRTSRSFPPLALRKGSLLPERSLTRRYVQIGSTSSWAEHHGGMWVEAQSGVRVPTVLEQAVCQSNGFKVTLLYIDGQEEEEREEAEDLSVKWRARLR